MEQSGWHCGQPPPGARQHQPQGALAAGRQRREAAIPNSRGDEAAERERDAAAVVRDQATPSGTGTHVDFGETPRTEAEDRHGIQLRRFASGGTVHIAACCSVFDHNWAVSPCPNYYVAVRVFVLPDDLMRSEMVVSENISRSHCAGSVVDYPVSSASGGSPFTNLGIECAIFANFTLDILRQKILEIQDFRTDLCLTAAYPPKMRTSSKGHQIQTSARHISSS